MALRGLVDMALQCIAGTSIKVTFRRRRGLVNEAFRDLKTSPEQVFTVDGSPLTSGPVSEMTVPLGVIFGSHQESVSFDLINSPNHTVLLGLPWLVRHDPYINWATRTLSSQFCHDHCYQSGE